MIRVSNINVNIEDNRDLIDMVAGKLKILKTDIIDFKIRKESIDARKKDSIFLVYTIDVNIKNEERILKNKKLYAEKVEEKRYLLPAKGDVKLDKRPVIVGSGPCGLFCGLILAEAGYRPIILERGRDVDARIKDVQNFWKNRVFNKDSNVQFGEGGAGTFSDGKLTTLVKDAESRMQKVLEEFVEAGAKEEILYKNKPHIGTDMLVNIVKNIREKIITLGGEVRFESKLTDIILENDKVKAIKINDTEILETDILVLAIGHSARDTFEFIYSKGIKIEQKPFSIGVRIEHKQSMIDKAQYGNYAGHKKLGAADYKLAYHAKNGRSAYTFCMCPGGEVVAAASEEGMVVTNGMSKNSRNKDNANSALLVNVGVEDFGSEHPLAGVEFQRKWERKAFQIAGSNYNAPAQLVGDFLKDGKSENVGAVKPSYTPNIKFTDLRECLPEYVSETIKEALLDFDKKIKGFANDDVLMTGVETRSSSPIRIVRGENMGSINILGIYPAGEGAGYAGGIMSAAIDGIKVAEMIMKKYI
ncbi:MAG TPA: hypothetical protein DCP90_01130 [Clostridiales bacterium]|nr:MAG: hypothetical protein A2Y22_07615 [Clostridiales bacterium GWD2_32_59]HAN09200.1 hypothetical protein [Clostridiales bacterium]